MDLSLSTLFGVGQAGAASLLLALAIAAGLVRGFVGFGAGMVFVPVASSVVGPAAAVGLIWSIDAPITLRLAVASLKGSRWKEIGPLVLGLLAGLPLGMAILTRIDPTLVRWGTALFILASVAGLASGWRYRRAPGVMLTLLVGFLSGVSTGIVGLGGPFIALFWLGGLADAEHIKQNLNSYFLITTLTVGPAFFAKGIITLDLVAHAVPLVFAYSLAAWAGLVAFRRVGQGNYRPIALIMAAASAIVSLPILDAWLR